MSALGGMRYTGSTRPDTPALARWCIPKSSYRRMRGRWPAPRANKASRHPGHVPDTWTVCNGSRLSVIARADRLSPSLPEWSDSPGWIRILDGARRNDEQGSRTGEGRLTGYAAAELSVAALFTILWDA